MELSKEQQRIVYATEPKIVVVAAAASGKTATLTARIKHLLESGVTPKEIVAITFTNAAGAEIRERTGAPASLYIGTVHGYANYLLRSIGQDTSKLLEDEQFDRLFEKVQQHPECIQHVTHLLVDEAQDSNKLQLDFFDMVNADNWMLVGDYRQALYEFNGARPDLLIDKMGEKGVTTYRMRENYRNGYEILDFAKGLIRKNGFTYEDDSIPVRDEPGAVLTIDYSVVPLIKTIKERGEYGKWFILCRMNSQVNEVCQELARQKVPYDTFKRAQLDNKDLNTKMKEDTVKVLTIHTSKGLENDNVVVVGARFRGKAENCVNYVAATRARNLLVWTINRKSRKNPIKVHNWED